jgi:IPT/TIG domain-containing protein/centrosomal CEP192-like protein/uncharacterized protein DUF4082
MSDGLEWKEKNRPHAKSGLARKVSRESFNAAQAHPIVSLGLLLLLGAALVPYGKPAHLRQNLNVTSAQPALQPRQAASHLSLVSAAPAGPPRKNPRPAAARPAPQAPTGPPNTPVLFSPGNGSGGAATSPNLDVSVTDPAGSNMTVTFYGRVASTVGPNFTIVALPDTQYYSSSLNGGTPAMFNAQTQWVVNNQQALNIAYVAHLGDIVQSGDNNGSTSEWSVADSAMKILEAANIPYGVHPGNHDEGSSSSDTGDASYTVLYNTYFGVSRFSGRSYYGGNYGTNNNNHYDLFSAGGMNFIAIYFAYDYNLAGDGLNPDFTSVLSWAQGVLQQYSDRHAILVSHYMMGNGNPANLSIQGGAIVNGLDGIPNVFLTLAGHYNTLPGEGQRTSVISGNTVQGLMSDYQDQPNGGNGWLRIMTFSPANNQISVQTYSPVLNQSMTDTASQFTVPWNMQNSGYTNVGAVSNVASGGQASVTWNNLAPGTQYQWYAVVSNGTYTTTGPTWSFTTSNSAAPSVSLSSSNLAFGSQLENTASSSQGVTLTNAGSATLNINSITASKDYTQTNTCGSQVLSNGTCNISVTFDPTVSGTDNGTVTISDNASGGSQTISLTGSGVAAAPVASLSTTNLSFGSQTLNTTSASQPVTLTNTGNASLSIQSMVTTGDFAASSCASSLAINASCKINVTFTPTATGTRNGSITITDNAGGSPQSVTLTGTGTSSGPPPTILLGDSNVEASVDYNTLGQAQAWPYTATTTGTVSTLWFYADSSSGNGPYLVGIYADASGTPGALLASGSIATTVAGTWNSVTLATSVNVTAGVHYWLALLGVSGNMVRFRDDGTACNSSGSSTGLKALPATWTTTGTWQSCPASVYGSGTAGVGDPPPSITSLSAASGIVGTSVTISGANFGSTGTVTFNGTSATATSWTAASVVVTVPNAATSGNVVVTVGGVASNGVPFTVTPNITGLSPTSGAVATAVTITGTGFGASQGGSTVKFNGTTATPTGWSATSIVVPVPSGASTGNVVVTVGGTASNGVSFTVSATAPNITSLSLASGIVGTAVTISGTNFGSSGTVTFNGTSATASSWTAASVVVTVPNAATSGNVVVTVGGVASNGVPFTVTPNITGLSPTSGAVATAVTITGTGFGASQGGSTVKFNGTTATPTGWSATSIVAPVPSGASTGNVVVTVGGAASNGVSFTVSATAPNITSLSLASGIVGTAVTISGTNFGSSGTVTFNGTSATASSWTTTSVVVTVPNAATSGNVVVTVGGVASNGVPFTVTPNITSLSPTSGIVGTAVTITGTGFGTSQGSSTLKFNSTTATPTGWSATSIVVPVPTGATTGNVVVTVGGVASNGVSFTVGHTIFLGDSNVEASVDYNTLGQAQAWPYTASTTGTVSTLWFYADSSSGNGPYLVGIYADTSGTPGTLLASASIATTTAGKWNSVTLAAPVNVTAGVKYWLALLGVSGNMVRFRDDGTACNSSGSATGLKALPATWTSAATWQSCPASVYGSN